MKRAIPNTTDMVQIPEGWFWMGSDTHFDWEKPVHRVWTDGFKMARQTVSRREYGMFIRATGAGKPAGWDDPLFVDAEMPVVGVNWFDAVNYCEWFSDLHDTAYRLPTEAEWEKACRGGRSNEAYAWGNHPPSSIEYFGGKWTGPRVPGQLPANDYGLVNIGDNVHEWCHDWFSESYYSVSPEKNPQGPEEGTRRVSRGGSWRHQIKASRAAHRSSLPPLYRYTDYGFRLVA
jgi:formylglycine-generating enzyme